VASMPKVSFQANVMLPLSLHVTRIGMLRPKTVQVGPYGYNFSGPCEFSSKLIDGSPMSAAQGCKPMVSFALTSVVAMIIMQKTGSPRPLVNSRTVKWQS
jgi:hypothetical protein